MVQTGETGRGARPPEGLGTHGQYRSLPNLGRQERHPPEDLSRIILSSLGASATGNSAKTVQEGWTPCFIISQVPAPQEWSE